MIARKGPRGQSHGVEPFERSIFDGTVVEIESVNVEDCLHAVPSPFDAEFGKNAGANSEEPAPRPAVETDRRDVRMQYTAPSRSVKDVFAVARDSNIT